MTSWPWMKGVEVAVANPCAPVCPEDDRPAVKDLLEENRTKVDKITDAVKEHPLYDAKRHDDLWILRFWLSQKKSKDAINAIKYTLELREKHGLDDKDIRDTPPHHVTEGKVLEFLQCWGEDAMIFTHPDPQRGVVLFLRLSSMDQHKVVETLTEDHWLAVYMYTTEWTFQWLDYVTRTTGRLTRSVRIADTAGISMGSFNRECTKRDGKIMSLMEDCYPQLLETIYLCNPPTVIYALFQIFRVILPKRVLDKVDMLNPSDKAKDRQRLYKHITEDYLPQYYGGNNPKLPHEM